MTSPSFRKAAAGVVVAAALGAFVVPGAQAQQAAGSADATAAQAEEAKLGSRGLRSGMSGADVKLLQQLLVRAGFKTGTDGKYGPSTKRAVQRFQRAARLESSGTAGKKTIQALIDAVNGSASQTNGGFDGNRKVSNRSLGDRIPLKTGMSGQDVRVLQDYLSRAGMKVKVDGEYGKSTRAAVRKFEQLQERNVDGTMDAGDVDALRGAVDGDKGLAPSDPGTTPLKLAPGQLATVGADGLAVAPQDAPDQVKQIIAAANAIAKKPYRYGGGHGKWQDTGYDCSGSVSYALYGAKLIEQSMPSGGFMTWGDAGPGQWVTIYSKPDHMYMIVAGLRFDTSGRDKTGSRWQKATRSSAGFTVRRPPGL